MLKLPVQVLESYLNDPVMAAEVLLGWKLDIGKLEKEAVGFDEKVAKAAAGLASIPGLDPALAARLVSSGFASPEVFEGVEAEDLIGMGFSEAEASDVLTKVAAHLLENA